MPPNFAASGFERLPDRAVNQQVEVRKIPAPEAANSSLVLCRSAQRRRQEVAMISTAEQRFLNDSERLQARIAKGKLKREAVIYMTLLRAEQGFSGLQGALGLRPHFNPLEERVEGHIFTSAATVRGRASHRDPQAAPELVYARLGIAWKQACPARKFVMK